MSTSPLDTIFGAAARIALYVHRIGRTGRIGHRGTSITFITYEAPLSGTMWRFSRRNWVKLSCWLDWFKGRFKIRYEWIWFYCICMDLFYCSFVACFFNSILDDVCVTGMNNYPLWVIRAEIGMFSHVMTDCHTRCMGNCTMVHNYANLHCSVQLNGLNHLIISWTDLIVVSIWVQIFFGTLSSWIQPPLCYETVAVI